MNVKRNIAVVGCGAWGKNHVRAFHELGALALVCDADLSRLAEVQEKFAGVETTPDFSKTLARPDIEGVVIATPAATHYSLALKALQAGKHVLVEKPLSLHIEEGERLLRAAQENGRTILVGHVMEYHPAIVRLKQLIGDGSLGRLQYVYSNRLNLGRIRTEEDVLWSFAPHDVALILRLVGTPAETIACSGGAYLNHSLADVTLTSLQFPNGVKGHIFVSWLHPFKDHKLVVVGDRQMAVFDDTAPWERKLLLYPHRVDWTEGRIPTASKAEAVALPLEPREPLGIECAEFLKSIETGKPALTDGASGLQVLRVLDTARKSMEGGGKPLPLSGPRPAFYAHPTAAVDPGSQVGDGTKIWHQSHVMAGAKIGKNCILGQNVFVAGRVVIGDGVKIQNNVSVYEGVTLEDHVFCGPSMVFTNVINPRSEIERKNEFRKTLVKRGATLGANCTIVCGNTVGSYALVAAGAVVTRPVPDYALVMGVPARIAGWVCRCGARLDFSTRENRCGACGGRFKMTSPETVEAVA